MEVRRRRWLTPVLECALLAVLAPIAQAPLWAGGMVSVQSQRITVTGRVVDIHDQPMPGVRVMEKGTKNGTLSDQDGNYRMSVASGSTLVYTYIGYKSAEMPASTLPQTVVLHEDNELLSEVVVVGYGTQKKLNLTGAVSTLEGEKLTERPLGNVAQGLQSMIPNLNITFSSGKPSTNASVNIRGNTSLNGGSALVLIDGVEGRLEMLNPEDIESVTVLKDAASASIYGARAAFGVLLVTTKKGKADRKTRVSYSNNFSWNTPARLPKMPSSDVWTRAWNQAYINEGGTGYFTDRFLKYVDAHIADPEHNPAVLVDTEGIQSPRYSPSNPGWAYVGNTDWLSEFYRDATFMHQHTLSVSGGKENSRWYFSAGLKDQDGIFRYGNDNYKRYNLTFNYDTGITKWLDLGFSTRYTQTRVDEPQRSNGGSWYYEVYRMFPTLPVFLPNGEFAGMSLNNGNYNVIGRMANSGRATNVGNDLWYTGKFDLHPIEGLSVKGNYTYNKYFSRNKIHSKIIYQTMPEGSETLVAEAPNWVSNGNGENTFKSLNLWAEYVWDINNEHNFKLMGGYNQEGKDYLSMAFKMSDLIDNNIPVSDLAKNYVSNSEGDTRWRVQGLFFRLNYDYLSRYLLEINGRYDGSSKFPPGKRHVFVPSASAGWRISEESFFSPMRSFVDNLKLRASVGMLGNQAISDYFSYLGTLSGGAMGNYLIDGKPLSYLSAPTLPSEVSWEKVVSQNYGLDWGLFRNRLTGSFDYYMRDTKDMIQNVTLPAVLGTGGGKENIADLRTRGWELEISWRETLDDILGDPLTYGLSAGIGDYQAEITKIDNPTGSLAKYYEGQKLGEYWGYITDGFIEDEEEAERMKTVQAFIYGTRWNPGDIRYKDLNGDGVINTGKYTLDDHGDFAIIGNNTPRYSYNIQGNFAWKGFDLWVMFDGVGKRDIWTTSDQLFGFPREIYNGNVFQWHIDNSWTPDHTDAYLPRPSLNNRNIQRQSKYMLNAAYFRLKNVTVGYTLPESLSSRIAMEKMRIYFSGYNLWEKTFMPPFMTPDIMENMKNGGDNSGKEYAFMRNFSFGLSMTF